MSPKMYLHTFPFVFLAFIIDLVIGKPGSSNKNLLHFFLLALTSSIAVFCQDGRIAELNISDIVQEAREWVENLKTNADNGVGGQTEERGGRYNEMARKIDLEQIIYDRSMEILLNRTKMPFDMARKFLLPFTKNACTTPSRISCAPSKYRSIEGSCNNLLNPSWGQAGTAQGRILPPDYEDGRQSPRGGLQNSSLPNPRFISTELHFNMDREFPGITNLVAAFGQFLDHDMVLSPAGVLPCCLGFVTFPWPNCWPIQIPENDPFYSQFQLKKCLNFMRSTSCTDQRGVRQQVNGVTAFIDASQVYGSTEERAGQLRTGSGGRLITNNQSRSFELPLVSQTTIKPEILLGDFSSGDDRVSETPGLGLMHNLFHKEHNRLADLIGQKRPDWNDERIYHEARRILIAEMQVIVYKEFLPVLLGSRILQAHGLQFDPTGMKRTVHKATVNPSILNDFSAVAYRFGHTLINNVFKLINPKTQETVGLFDIKDQYFNSDMLVLDDGRGTDYIMTSMLKTQAQDFDPFFATGLTNFLFRLKGMKFGQDLVARNIQRGRDHGIPGFNSYRRYCGLDTVNALGPPSNIPADAWKRLLKVYEGRAEDIEFYSGGLHEQVAHGGGIAGATFQCIIAIQFQRLKYGDRYFFSHRGQEGSFSSRQIQELSKRRISDVICNNGIQPFVQDNAFRIPSSENPNIFCSDGSRNLDIDMFVDSKEGSADGRNRKYMQAV